MKKSFNEFSVDEQKKLFEVNNYILTNKLLNRKTLFDNFVSLINIKQKKLGLNGLITITKRHTIETQDTTFSVNLLGTIDKLIKTEVGNLDIIETLKKSKISCKLLKELTLTLSVNFASIYSKNEQIAIRFERYIGNSSYYMEDNRINYLFDEIENYTQNPKIKKKLKKVKLQKIYTSEIDYALAEVIFDVTYEELKSDLKIFENYMKHKIENMKNELQKEYDIYLDNATSFIKVKEILDTRTDILFDENDFTIFIKTKNSLSTFK
jgi:hypothetical protein